MWPRVFVPDVQSGDGEIALPSAEAHHLGRVLRLGEGAEIRVFDGRGHEYVAEVTSVTRQAMRIRVLTPVETAPLPRVALTIVQSVLKGDGMDGVVRDGTMVGVAAIRPVVSERTTVKAALLARAHERWQRVALAAATQCGRARLPAIAQPVPLAAWMQEIGEGPVFLLVEPAVAAGALRLRDLVAQPTPAAATLVIGPEGGWTPAERDAAVAAGCTPLTLGPLTLRAESVPLAAAAALLALWE
jgi:16S rRNA (uracil1498-N3)-methyltransferase